MVGLAIAEKKKKLKIYDSILMPILKWVLMWGFITVIQWDN